MPCSTPGTDGGTTTGTLDRSRQPAGAAHAVRAAFLSLLLPGAGQLWLGRRQRGIVLTVISLTTVLLVAGALAWDLSGLASVLVRPGVLDALLVANVAILVFRGFAIVDAYGSGRRPPPLPPTVPGSGPGTDVGFSPSKVRIVAATLALIVVLPHVAVGYYGLQARATLGGVFPVATAEAADLAAVGMDAATWTEDGRLTVLLIGSDAGPRRSGVRTDTIMVASVEVGSGRAAMISIPRNLVRVPLPTWVPSDHRCRCFPDPINGLYAAFRDRTDLVPDGVDPGAAVLRGSVEQLLGVRIDHHAVADLRGFVDAVDALGGVTIDVDRRVFDQLDSPDPGEWDAIDLRPGRHHLDGREALVYVRTRRSGDDYLRMARQRCFLGALLDQTGAADVLRAFPKLTAIMRTSISTDLPRDTLASVVDLAAAVDPSGIDVLSVTPPDLARRDTRGYPVADVSLVRAAVRALLGPDRDPMPVMRPATETATSTVPLASPAPAQPLSRSCRP